MLLFFGMIILIILILLLSEIKIVFNDFIFEKLNNEKNIKYDCRVKLYFLKYIKLLSIKVNNKKINNKKINNIIEKNIKNNFKKLKTETSKDISKEQLNILKKVLFEIFKKLKIEKINLKILLDSKNVIFTSYLVGFISIIISNIIVRKIEKYNNKKCKFSILPIYKNNRYVYINLNCIISIKIVHIINMLRKVKN